MVKAIVGANWGDEGKGKITDVFAAQSDVVIRFQGGSNAGHTIINDYGKFSLHQLPSGVFYEHITNIIGNGVALNIDNLTREIRELTERGVPKPNILVSDRCQIVMPYHVLLDQYEEERLSDKAFGSTKSGIAPFYSDKYAKVGFEVCELYDDELLKEKLGSILEIKNKIIVDIYGKPALSFQSMLDQLFRWRDEAAPYKGDTFQFLNKAIKEGKNILLEGQLGTLKDTDFGIYPMVTSSSTLAGYGAVGAGIPPYEIREVVAVVKAYSSAVGAGEFVSEIFGEEANELRLRGGDAGEFGATTGRPRRMGLFDVVATRYGCQVQGATQVALTCVDVLGYMDEIKICTGYELNGQRIDHFPATPELRHCKPIVEVLPGWKCDIRGIKTFSELPDNCKQFVLYVENALGVPITIVSNGPKRDNIIYR